MRGQGDRGEGRQTLAAATKPMVETTPPKAMASKDCSIVPGPPTSTMWSTPRPLVCIANLVSSAPEASRKGRTDELQRFLGPLRRRFVVDPMIGSELLRILELLVAPRSDDHRRSRSLGNLQSEDRDSAGALEEDGVARLERVAGGPEEGVVGRDGGAGQSRGLVEGHPLGYLDKALHSSSALLEQD